MQCSLRGCKMALLCVCVCGRQTEREKHNTSYLLPGLPPLPLNLEAQLCFCGSLWLSYENLLYSTNIFIQLPTTQQFSYSFMHIYMLHSKRKRKLIPSYSFSFSSSAKMTSSTKHTSKNVNILYIYV